MPIVTKILPAKALRYGSDVADEPNVWSFRGADRGQLTVDPEGLVFGSWSVRRREVIDAHWFTAREMPIQLTAILRVRTRDHVFEFAFEPWRLSPTELPFGVDRSEFSILSGRAKLVLAAGLAAAIVGFALAGYHALAADSGRCDGEPLRLKRRRWAAERGRRAVKTSHTV